jgi:hypothetical protein
VTAAGRRWCEQHQRHECASLRRYRTAYCHNAPLKGTAKCQAHTSREPATSPRALAHQQVAAALAEGRLVRPDTCELCGACRDDRPAWGLYAHHEDYSRPLDVIWLCGSCHQRVHGHHRGLAAYVAWLRAQLAAAERVLDRQLAAAAAA